MRSDALRGAGEVLARVEAKLAVVRGIVRVACSSRTGSVVIDYTPGDVDPDELVARVSDATGLAVLTRPPPVDRPALVAIEVVREANAVAEKLTGGRLDLRSAVPAALAGMAAYAFWVQKGKRLPRWDNLLYWSYSVFTSLHHQEIATPDTASVDGVDGVDGHTP